MFELRLQLLSFLIVLSLPLQFLSLVELRLVVQIHLQGRVLLIQVVVSLLKRLALVLLHLGKVADFGLQ